MARIEKSRKRRIKYQKIPSGVSVKRIKRKSKQLVCITCKNPLHGITNTPTKYQKKLTKSNKRPERRFGGVLCSNCSRRALISRLRSQEVKNE